MTSCRYIWFHLFTSARRQKFLQQTNDELKTAVQLDLNKTSPCDPDVLKGYSVSMVGIA